MSLRFSLTGAGLVRVHGPLGNRCPGSGKTPKQVPLRSSSPTAVLSLPALSASLLRTQGQSSSVAPLLSPSTALRPPSESSAFSGGHPPSLQQSLPNIPSVRVVDWIPRAARQQASLKLCSILEDVVHSNSVETWNRLFLFPTNCLRLPPADDRATKSLTTKIKEQILLEDSPPPHSHCCQGRLRHPSSQEDSKSLLRHVSKKIEVGDLRGAIWLVSSDDTLTDFDDATLAALQSIHPVSLPDSRIPPPPPPPPASPTQVLSTDVLSAIKSFPNGSAGGPDHLRPQHLKNMLPNLQDPDDSPMLSGFCSLVLRGGETPDTARPLFFGASLVALRKKQGGIRPIAVGCTLHHVVAKIAGHSVMEEMADLLSPRQLGYGIQGGTEAAVHVARFFSS